MKSETLLPKPLQNASGCEIKMSSVEIAELCGKRHDHVMVDIRKMLAELNLNSPEFSGQYKTKDGRMQPCFFLPKRETLILVSGYRIDLRAKIIDRLDELENQQAVRLPQNFAEALRLAADLEEEKSMLVENHQQAVQIESMESYFRNGISPFEFVKGLNGVNSLKVGEYLVGKSWLYENGSIKRVAAYARDRYLTEETTEIAQHGKEPFLAYKPVLLRKGAAKLYEWYTKGKLPMKKNWNGEYTQDKAVGL